MTKAELVSKIAELAAIKKKDAEAAVEAFIKAVTEALANGDKVELRGFGTFYMKKRAKRVARNPKTGQEIEVPPKLTPAFKPGKELKEKTEKILK